MYIPGSAFKVVTAAAALDSGKFTLNSTFYDPGYCIEYGKQVTNFADQSGPEVFGTVNFVAGDGALDQRRLLRRRKGARRGRRSSTTRSASASTRSLRSRRPSNERADSGLYKDGKLFFPKNDFQVDPGRLAFGQERLLR